MGGNNGRKTRWVLVRSSFNGNGNKKYNSENTETESLSFYENRLPKNVVKECRRKSNLETLQQDAEEVRMKYATLLEEEYFLRNKRNGRRF